ncbi:hypothetical protein U0070_025329 [Myodes glareolus]|uniref:Uncharacterized protein n=1 Tax=Myodes glareolus TaxID=447135 RepID=A0AAW0JMF2_MYOGA
MWGGGRGMRLCSEHAPPGSSRRGGSCWSPAGRSGSGCGAGQYAGTARSTKGSLPLPQTTADPLELCRVQVVSVAGSGCFLFL